MFYILITIALIAMLTAYMARGNRTQESTLTSEQAKLAAQEIIDYGSALANAVQKLRLRGCLDTQFNFGNTVWTRKNTGVVHSDNHNPSAPDAICDVFGIGAGDIAAKTFSPIHFAKPVLADGQIDIGSSNATRLSMPNVGSSEADLVYHIPHVSEAVCERINIALGIQTTGQEIPVISITGNIPSYNGSYSSSGTLNDEDGKISGKLTYCGYDGGYRFFQTLLAR